MATHATQKHLLRSFPSVTHQGNSPRSYNDNLHGSIATIFALPMSNEKDNSTPTHLCQTCHKLYIHMLLRTTALAKHLNDHHHTETLYISDVQSSIQPSPKQSTGLHCLKVGHDNSQHPQQHPHIYCCLLYTSPSPRDRQKARMPSSA